MADVKVYWSKSNINLRTRINYNIEIFHDANLIFYAFRIFDDKHFVLNDPINIYVISHNNEKHESIY